jgi:hypothetical protein
MIEEYPDQDEVIGVRYETIEEAPNPCKFIRVRYESILIQMRLSESGMKALRVRYEGIEEDSDPDEVIRGVRHEIIEEAPNPDDVIIVMYEIIKEYRYPDLDEVIYLVFMYEIIE